MGSKIKKETIAEIEREVMAVASRQKRDFTFENRVLFVYAEDARMQPNVCAERVNRLWNGKETGNSVIGIFKGCHLIPPEKRERVFREADKMAHLLIEYLSGAPFQTEELEAIEKRLEDKAQTKRIILNDLYRMIPQLREGRSFSAMLRLNKDFAGECLDSIITYIRLELGGTDGMEAYEKEIFRLEAELQRANRMLVHLQDEFDERIEENQKEERASLISQLNSQKYGYILDMLTDLQTGARSLRRSGTMLPPEINALPSLLRQMIRFISDCGITPIMEIGEELTIKAADAMAYQYLGTPFADENEEKTVIVTTTGWEIRDEGITISSPTVQEKE